MVILFFKAVLGLHINYSMNVLYPVNDVRTLLEISETLGCTLGSFPAKYLGLPLEGKSKSVAIWDYILENM